MLLNDGLKVSSKMPEQLSDEMDAMATKGLRFLNYLATADLSLLQVLLRIMFLKLNFSIQLKTTRDFYVRNYQ